MENSINIGKALQKLFWGLTFLLIIILFILKVKGIDIKQLISDLKTFSNFVQSITLAIFLILISIIGLKRKLFILFIVLFSVVSGCNKDNQINETVKDEDGNIYYTVVIGTQTWMLENLKTTKYNDGTKIPNMTENKEWELLATGAYCNYDNKELNADDYGRLYNWYAVNTGKLAPKGWHVATDTDWSVLTDYLGGLDVAGGKIKEVGTTHWNSPNTGATNSSGFTALPGGGRYFDGYFTVLNSGAVWWTSTAKDDSYAWFRSIGYNIILVRSDIYILRNGHSVRCIKD